YITVRAAGPVCIIVKGPHLVVFKLGENLFTAFFGTTTPVIFVIKAEFFIRQMCAIQLHFDIVEHNCQHTLCSAVGRIYCTQVVKHNIGSRDKILGRGCSPVLCGLGEVCHQQCAVSVQAYGISIEAISAAISAANRNTPAGSFDLGSNAYSLRVDHEFKDPNELLDIVVGVRNGAAILLRDVADIDDTLQDRIQEAYNNNERGGMIIIQKKSGANAVQIAKAVQKQLAEIQKTLPSDVKLFTIVDTSENIIHTVNSLRDTIITTMILVILVVFLFLGRWRATIVVVLTIPISLLAAIIYLMATGNTLNIITMSSLSIAIGMVVDNAIVVLENITSHTDRGAHPKQAAIFATKEVGISVMGGTLTTIAVFLPLTMIQGMAGILFNSMGWMVTITLTVSTLAAITFTPVLCALMMKKSPKKAWFQGKIDAAMDRFNNVYGRMLGWCVEHRKTVITLSIALFAGVIGILGPRISTGFFPTQDNARIGVDIQLPVGTGQDITRELALEISERFRKAYPEIKTLN
ncbi:MAG: efflux RND transporter permease subunit, partial [Rikenellaceae bacterium]|nr:efflux RND transporter permease subunit [Rikenellaceae bacterium]